MDDLTNNLIRDLQKSVSEIGQKMATRDDLARLEIKIDTKIQKIEEAQDGHSVEITTLKGEAEATKWISRTLIAAVFAIVVGWANNTWHIVDLPKANAATPPAVSSILK